MIKSDSNTNATKIDSTTKKADELVAAEEQSLKVLTKLFDAVNSAEDENTAWITKQDVNEFVQEIIEKERLKNVSSQQVIRHQYLIGSGKYRVEVRIENPARGDVKYLFLYKYDRVIKWVAF